MQTTLILTITHTKPIADLADKVAGRAYTLDGCENAEAHAIADPMDWPLPCDVTVGHGTMQKGVKLRTLVTRMEALYGMATGQDASEVANRTDAARNVAVGCRVVETERPSSHAGQSWRADPG